MCQQEKKEELKSPDANPARRECDGYHNIATNVPLFATIRALPLPLDVERLDEGPGIKQTLRSNKAVYHQSCRLLFSNSKLERAKKRTANESEFGSDHMDRAKKQRTTSVKDVCFMYEKEGELRNASTMKLNDRLNQCARLLNDVKLIAKLSGGDVVAQELKYHPTCLASLYNKVRSHLSTQEGSANSNDAEKTCCAIAFSELITYIIESCNSTEGPHTFRLVDLVQLYKQRVEQLGIDSRVVNSTRLKEQY